MQKLLGVRELSGFLGVPVTWIYDRVRMETIPFYKLGKYVKFDLQEVGLWLEAQRKGSRLDNSTYKDKLPLSIVDRKEACHG